jgi:lysyl endopeptidase
MKNFAKVLPTIFVAGLLLLSAGLSAQVFTRILDKEQKFETFMPWPVDKDMVSYRQPDVDFQKVLDEDKLRKRPIHRVAVKVEKNYKVKDGMWSDLGDIAIWQIGFDAPKASSLNFLMSNLVLPEGAEMYIFSEDRRIVHGPIEPKHIFKGQYASDIIEASQVAILVKCPKETADRFSISIDAVNQGLPLKATLRGFGDASDCNVDVNCFLGAGWENERDAVAFVIKNGEDHCSGVLINNQCQDFRPFFLTAFHCLDANENGELSAGEQNLGAYAFRFKYEAGTPTCPGNSTGNQGTWIVYNGATFRSGNDQTDFALTELNGTITNQSNLAVAGWNRNTTVPQQTVTCIHHPRGDAKKISTDNRPLILTNPQMFIVQRWGAGLVEPGSSGSPLFDNARRIIGQLSGGDLNIGCFDGQSLIDNNRYGRFDLSWTGGGTNDTRLSNWLGGVNPPMTMNTIRSPWINTGGSNVICTSNRNFSLTDRDPALTVTWSVTNTGLFATTGGASTSGNGATATLRALDNIVHGSAVLTYTLTGAGCNTFTVSQDIWVGKPAQPTVYPSGYPTVQLDLGTYLNAMITAAPGASVGTGNWSATGSITLAGSNPGSTNVFEGTALGNGNFYVNTTNVCGTSANSGGAVKVNDGGGGPFRLVNTPNPANRHFVCEIVAEDIPQEHKNNMEDLTSNLYVLDQAGRVVTTQNFNGKRVQVATAPFTPGLYVTKVQTSFGVFTGKVMIQQ